LQWAADNIAAFAGNPGQVTVGDQSTGSLIFLDMTWSPLFRDLIAGVLSEAGARGPKDPNSGELAINYRTKDTAEAQRVSFLKLSTLHRLLSSMKYLLMETLIDYWTNQMILSTPTIIILQQ
jgi:carboxylesterase 2